MILDESGDYLPAFAAADIFVSDTTSLLIEAFATGKPVIYCGLPGHFDRETRKWARLMYCARSWREVEGALNRLLEGNDPEKSSREEYISAFIKFGEKVGRKIIDFIILDFLKNK